MSVVGKTGYIVTATRGRDGAGEVSLPLFGKFLAWSKDPVPQGTQVLIIAERDTRALEVEPL